MRFPWGPAAVALAAALAAFAVPAQAALNGPRAYEDSFPFQEGFVEGGAPRIVSGGFDGPLGPVEGSFGFFDTDGTRVTGLTRACWGATLATCRASPGGELEVLVRPGGSFGLRAPAQAPASADLAATHGLSLFIDFGGDDQLNSFDLGRSLVSAVVGSEVAFDDWPGIVGGLQPDDTWGGAVALEEGTRLEVREGLVLHTTLGVEDSAVWFAGEIQVEPFSPGLLVVPFPQGARLEVRAAPEAAAREGLDLARVEGLLSDLDEADPDTADGSQDEFAANRDLWKFRDLLAAVLDGAVLSTPASGNGTDGFLLVRFGTLEIRSTASGLAWEGRSPLQIQDGHVHGAAALVGFAFFALPWWSYLLWGLAIAAFVVRLSLKPSKRNERWDRLRWVGWVAGPLSALLVLFLWDLETRAVWGTSLLAGDAKGIALVVVLSLQFIPYAGAMFAVAVPLRILIRNGFLLGRQGTFMGLAGAIAYPLGFLLGAHLLRAYLDLYLQQVVGALGG